MNVIPAAEVPPVKVSAPKFMSSSVSPPPPPIDAPTSEAPVDPNAPPAPPEPPAQAKWPEWFPSVDKALIVLALLFAFLMASFAARNTDLYRHMAGGQRLLNGSYSLGTDPFSFTGPEANRPWVNPSWLFDLGIYGLYSLDQTGAVSVVAKAVVFALAFGVLLWFRRSEQSGLTWAILLPAGALTASASAQLRPLVFGMLFFSLLLLMVFRGDWSAPRRTRMLLLIGVLSWFWGGIDPFAVLAPLVLLTVALARVGQKALESPSEAAPTVAPSPAAEGEPTPTIPTSEPPTSSVDSAVGEAKPPISSLVLAALVSLVGLMLNPTFIVAVLKNPVEAVAQLLPTELAPDTIGVLADDVELRSITLSILSPDYWRTGALGLNATSIGLFVLVIVGAIGLAVGGRRTSVEWIGLWFVLLVLCAANARFLPFFALAAVPLGAGLLVELFERVRLGTVVDSFTRQVFMVSRLSRILAVPGMLVLLAATVPGWLHPQSANPALLRRVEWRIVPDEAIVRALNQLQTWRIEEGCLTPGDRGLLAHPEFGDCAAWFAPNEPVFLNSRYRFHTAEFRDIVAIRNAVFMKRRKQDPTAPPPKSAAPVADRYGASYVIVGRPNFPTEEFTVINTIVDFSEQKADLSALWYLDGRTAIVGRANTPRAMVLRERLQMNPVRVAFSRQENLGEGPTQMPLLQGAGSWLSGFLDPPTPPLSATDDARIYLQLTNWTQEIEDQKSVPVRQCFLAAAGSLFPPPPRFTLSDGELALPLLTLRSARLAVIQAPDEPAPYMMLAQAYDSRLVPEVEPGERIRQRLTALARCAARLPEPESCPNWQFSLAYNCYRALFSAQCEQNQFDLARETIKKLRVLIDTFLAANPDIQPKALLPDLGEMIRVFAPRYRQILRQEFTLGGEFQFEDEAKKSGRNDPSPAMILKRLDDAVTQIVAGGNEAWEREGNQRKWKPGERALFAVQFGLHGKANGLLDECLKDGAPNPGVPKVALALAFIDLQLETGRLEQAHASIGFLEESVANMAAPESARFQSLKSRKLLLQGSFTQAQELLDARVVGQFRPLSDTDKQLVFARPIVDRELISFAAGPWNRLFPTFTPPADLPPDQARARMEVFQKQYLATHPFIVAETSRRNLLDEAYYHYQRALLSLLAGDTPAARQSLVKIDQPQGVPLFVVLSNIAEFEAIAGQRFNPSSIFPSLQFIPAYFNLLKRYNPDGAPK